MMTLTEKNIISYLRNLGALHPSAEEAAVTTLGGGVSNVVLRVTQGDTDMVVKQALPQLNVAEEWLATVERVAIEVECLRLFSRELPAGTVPRLLYYDPDNFSYGMTMLPETFRMWKAELLEKHVRPDVAKRVGRLLGEAHAMTWDRRAIGDSFDDVEHFVQLRIDPYYKTTQSRHPDEARFFDRAIEMALHARYALVHGDFSPKNILVNPAGDVVLLDFEVAHYGDPAFDAAFLINHLVLKAVYLPSVAAQLIQSVTAFWDGYAQGMARRERAVPGDLEERIVIHLGCMQLARIDGKSPAEYIETDTVKNAVRTFAKDMLHDGVDSIDGVLERLGRP